MPCQTFGKSRRSNGTFFSSCCAFPFSFSFSFLFFCVALFSFSCPPPPPPLLPKTTRHRSVTLRGQKLVRSKDHQPLGQRLDFCDQPPGLTPPLPSLPPSSPLHPYPLLSSDLTLVLKSARVNSGVFECWFELLTDVKHHRKRSSVICILLLLRY